MRNRVLTGICAAQLAAALTAAAPRQAPGQPMQGTTPRGFELSAGQSLDENGDVLLVLSTAISHRRLVFFRTQAGYEARYRIFIDLRGKDGRRVSGDVEEETVSVPEYEMTRSPRLLSNLRATIAVDPGEYTAKVAIEVIGTSLRYEREVKVQVFGREHGAFEITQPSFSVPGPDRLGERPPSGELVYSYCSGAVPRGFLALAGGAFTDPQLWVRMSVTVLTPVEERTSASVEFSLRVSTGDRPMIRYSRRMIDTGDEGRAIVCLDMNVDELPMGRYEVQAAVGIPHSTKKAVSSGSFTVLISRAMFAGRFEETLELLSYIAEDRELEPLRSAPPELRLEEWERFFENHDLLVCPMSYGPAPKRCKQGTPIQYDGRTFIYLEYAWPYLTCFNASGHPAMNIPLGIGRDGLPVGIQVVGPYWSEPDLIQFAKLVSEFTPGFIRPEGY